LPKKKL